MEQKYLSDTTMSRMSSNHGIENQKKSKKDQYKLSFDNNQGMSRMTDKSHGANVQNVKDTKKEAKKHKKLDKLDEKKQKILSQARQNEKIFQLDDDYNINNAKAISSFSKGHSTYTLR